MLSAVFSLNGQENCENEFRTKAARGRCSVAKVFFVADRAVKLMCSYY